MRAIDEPIPPEELLYRSFAEENIVGDVVLPGGIDCPTSSFNRSKYSRPADVARDGEPRVVALAAGNLPPPLPRENASPIIFFAADAPEEFNEAHCEIRLRREGEAYAPKWKPSSTMKAQIRSLLAQRMQVVEL